MLTVIDVRALVDHMEAQAAKRGQKDKDAAYRFSNGREFERSKDPYENAEGED